MKPAKRAQVRAAYPDLKAFHAERRRVLALMGRGAVALTGASIFGCIVKEEEADPAPDALVGRDLGGIPPPPQRDGGVDVDVGGYNGAGGGGGAGYNQGGGWGEPDAQPPMDVSGVPDASWPEEGWGGSGGDDYEGEAGGGAGYNDEWDIDAAVPPPDAAVPPEGALRVPAEGYAYHFGEAEGLPDGFEVGYHLIVYVEEPRARAFVEEAPEECLRIFAQALDAMGFACTSLDDVSDPFPALDALYQALVQRADAHDWAAETTRVIVNFDHCAPQFLAGDAPGW